MIASDDSSMFYLSILEHPYQVRTSGMAASATGRSIDPVPILQLCFRDSQGNVLKDGDADVFSAATFFVVHVRLYSADGSHEIDVLRSQRGSHAPRRASTTGTTSAAAAATAAAAANLTNLTTPAMMAIPQNSSTSHDSFDRVYGRGHEHDSSSPAKLEPSGTTFASASASRLPHVHEIRYPSDAHSKEHAPRASSHDLNRLNEGYGPAANIKFEEDGLSQAPWDYSQQQQQHHHQHRHQQQQHQHEDSTVDLTPLFGNLVSPSYVARDLDQRLGIFFIFGNLCIRLEGSFRLRFTLVDLRL
ncbi:uncharacterized protein BJ171DRAFT_219438 [Polychytrium aggregatum]|uniref:uncharacterized protein n=1 Tax=Polychytrium aggregatum TaxID=110093 RepID=UPI0022FDD068|nr:uncharacterized protein BJ171DRAFT_219438 [Polychytrium aggregatum]KAI9199272.1 hypothetical protein BJ171DRAFT_219438 [Polychytrium aggregatum]